jgi:hypothetical protein
VEVSLKELSAKGVPPVSCDKDVTRDVRKSRSRSFGD